MNRAINPFERGLAEFVTRDGAHVIAAIVARTHAARARGLLGASDFRGRVAMVLVFDPPESSGRVWITTRGMYVPIDVVFARPSGEPIAIVEDARPDSGVYAAEGDERIGYVVEMPSGTAREIGVDRDSLFRLLG